MDAEYKAVQDRAVKGAEATLAAFADPVVMELHQTACAALMAFAVALQDHDVPLPMVAGQLHQCASTVLLQGLGLD